MVFFNGLLKDSRKIKYSCKNKRNQQNIGDLQNAIITATENLDLEMIRSAFKMG